MALSSELHRRLRAEDESLSKRLQLAKNSFKHTELFINKKEEIVLNWLCNEGQNNVHSVAVWQTLLECLSSNRMLNLSAADIKTSEKVRLIEVLSDSLVKTSTADQSYKIILQCIFHILENVNFHYYFRKQLQDYANLNKVFLRGVSQVRNDQLFIKCVENLVLFHKLLPHQDELGELFIKEILLTLIESYCSLRADNASDSIKLKLIHCVEKIVFPRTKYNEILECFCAVFGSSVFNSSNLICELFIFLSKATSFSESIAGDVFYTVFQAFVQSYKKESSVCGLFLIMCYFLGFKPSVGRKAIENSGGNTLTHKNFKHLFHNKIDKSSKASATSLVVLRTLLEVLSDNSVQLDVDVGGSPFRDWLEALVSCVLNVKICGHTFDVLNSVIVLNPLIIEAKINNVLECTVLVQEDFMALKLSYISFLRNVLVMFNKLHRIQKFTTKFLTTILCCTIKSDAEEFHLKSSDILPAEICQEFCNSMTTLPGSQYIEMIKSLTFHVKQDCIEGLQENFSRDGFLLYVEVLADVVCHFLEGVRLAEHSIPAMIVEKFVNALVEFREALGRLGTALLHKEHCRRLMVSYLRMCYSCGELQVLLLHYSPRCETKNLLQLAETKGDYSATNLEFLHSYLNHEQWNLVAQRIKNFGEDACKEMLNKLILQKLRVAILFNGNSLEVSSPIAKHVLGHINEMWPLLLSNNIAMLMPLFTPEQLQEVANYLVLKLVNNDLHTKTLQSTAIQENRPLVILFSLAVLNQISKLFTKRKRKLNHSEELPPSSSQLARHVLSVLNNGTILNQHEQDLSSVTSELAAVINKACESYDNSKLTNGFTLDVHMLENYLKLLKSLPLLFLPREIRTLLVFSVLAVAVSLSALASGDTNKFATVKSLYAELLLVLLDGPNPPNLAAHLHLGQLMTCLPDLGLDQPLLLQHLFNMCLRQEGTLKQLEVGVPLLDRAACKQELDKASLERGTLLLQCLSKVKKTRIPADDRILCRKFKKRLSRVIVSYIKRCNANGSPQWSPDMLECFSLALQTYVTGSGQNLNKITCFLNSFIQTAISRLSDTSQPCPAAITLLGTVLRHKSKLEEFLSSDCISQVWAVLSTEQHVPNAADQLTRLLEVARDEEFQRIVSNLLKETHSCIHSEGHSQLPHILRLWKCIALSSVNKTKSSVRETSLHQACLHVMSQLSLDAKVAHIAHFLELEVTLSKRRLVKESAPLLDLFLETIAIIPMKERTTLADLVTAINLSLELLTTVMLHWTTLVLTRIPPFLQCFRRLIANLAEQSSISKDLSSREISQLASCAHGIERLTNAVVRQKKDFAPVSGFAIADILYQFEKYTIYPPVKIHLTNAVYILLQLCDKHALAHLFRALPPGSKELFSTAYRNYKRYYRFTGKV